MTDQKKDKNINIVHEVGPELYEKYATGGFISPEIPQKIWRSFPGEWCPKCGANLLIHTYSDLPNGFGHSDDKIKCPNTYCNKTGVFIPRFKQIHQIIWDCKVREDGHCLIRTTIKNDKCFIDKKFKNTECNKENCPLDMF